MERLVDLLHTAGWEHWSPWLLGLVLPRGYSVCLSLCVLRPIQQDSLSTAGMARGKPRSKRQMLNAHIWWLEGQRKVPAGS